MVVFSSGNSEQEERMSRHVGRLFERFEEDEQATVEHQEPARPILDNAVIQHPMGQGAEKWLWFVDTTEGYLEGSAEFQNWEWAL